MYTFTIFTIFTGAHIQNISKVFASNMTVDSVRSTNGSNINLGSPQIFTAYIHNFWAGFKPIIVKEHVN